jgi:hypothetical protein
MNGQNVLQHIFKAAGWSPGPETKGLAQRWILETVTTVSPADGTGWELFPAAESALAAFCGLTSPSLAGAGEEVAPRGFAVDPRPARHALGTFRAFGARIGCSVFPFGSTDGRGMLAVDEQGRLFCVDHGGWWFLGESADEGLGALAVGRAPRRVRDDGTWAQAPERPWSWTGPPVQDIDAVTDVVRTGHPEPAEHGVKRSRLSSGPPSDPCAMMVSSETERPGGGNGGTSAQRDRPGP